MKNILHSDNAVKLVTNWIKKYCSKQLENLPFSLQMNLMIFRIHTNFFNFFDSLKISILKGKKGCK